ncbi:MAG TPA: outer membrane beta-barrel protein [Phnomibacter sp.]|nr:outer membrane beta-barrel protein [Lacibacter sp.]HMO90513.1 outer membrane beta-barrel protein [Lacibacter sp.]HMP92830.1 outer membrane beta-barrel protein [Phnomibacter sp.]
MKQTGLLLLFLALTAGTFAQDTTDTKKKKKDWSQVNLSNRPKDHLMFQFGLLNWSQAPDSIPTKGLARTFNFAFSFDFPFKTDPRFSVGMGVGVGSDHMLFDKGANRDLIINNSNGVQWRRNTGIDSTIRYKGQKLHTAYLEAPVEIRFMSKPETPNKSLKFALGMKIGTMVTAVDKTKFDSDAAGNRQYNTKVKDRKNFSSLRLAATARVAMGNFGLFAQYQLNDFIKEGQGPSQIRPFSVGLTVSGL